MFGKIISFIMALVMTTTGFVTTSVSNIVDAVTVSIFGVPYTDEAVESGFFNDMDDSDVVELGEDSGFIKDKIAVFVDSDMSFWSKIKFFKECGGTLSGWCTLADLYVVSYPSMDYEQVLERCEKLNSANGVELAIPVMINKTVLNGTPDDDFGATYDEPNVWDELNPSGNNWWLEAINARQAWDYSDYFGKINIGVLDSGFETNHSELSGKISFPDSFQSFLNTPHYHGTHVAGIIGANHDGSGIAGICENSNLICVDWTPDGLQFWITDIAIFFGISTLVKSGAKVINLSLGTSGTKGSNSSGIFERVFGAAATSYMMASLLSKGYDFVAVQSAGNGDSLGDPVNAENNGHFCVLSEDNIFVGSKNVSAKNILDRIIVVSSISNNGDGTYTQSDFSNVGRSVSIAAPGDEIYSCVDGGDYDEFSGTSMAAPMVTGVASLVWSVNPSFTGAQVKEIVCTSTDKVAQVNSDAKYYYNDLDFAEYPVVNAKLAVEEAIRRTVSSVGTASGNAGEAAEKIVYAGKTYTVYSDGSYSFVAPAGSGTAEVYDNSGNLINTFELTVNSD
ncbi:MAG: hypothetical protein E7547_04445 [Ruminococcaceae bacterium]|nr:hypothetical protein [Oscillospiraceae bacterium]